MNCSSAGPALTPAPPPVAASPSQCCSVTVRNVYFEPVPLRLLAGLVTERGMLAPGDIPAALDARRQQYAAAFGLPS